MNFAIGIGLGVPFLSGLSSGSVPLPPLAKYYTSSPVAAFNGFTASNYFTCTTGDGPDLAQGKSIVIAYRAPESPGIYGICGYNGANCGWKLYSAGQTVTLACFNASGVVSHQMQSASSGYRVIAITRLDNGAIRSSTNGGQPSSSAAATTYTENTSQSKFTIGRDNPVNGTYSAKDHQVLWIARVDGILSDANLIAYSRNDYDDRMAIPSALLAAADKVVQASDWNGVSGTFSSSKGQLTMSVVGSPSKVTLPGEDLYNLISDEARPYWSTSSWGLDYTSQGSPFMYRDNGASISLLTNSDQITPRAFRSLAGLGLNYATAGTEWSAINSQPIYGLAEQSVSWEYLPSSGIKTVFVQDGLSAAPAFHSKNSVAKVGVTAGSSLSAVSRAALVNGWVHLGDSGSVGVGSSNCGLLGGVFVASRYLKQHNSTDMCINAYQGNKLYDYASSPQLISDYVDKVDQYLKDKTTKTFSMLIGRADYAAASYTPTAFASAFQALANALLAKIQHLKIFVISPLIATDEGALVGGYTLQNFRDSLQSAALALGPDVAFFDGSAWVSASNLTSLVLPNDVGQQQITASWLYDISRSPRAEILYPLNGGNITQGVNTIISGTIDRGQSVTSAQLIVNGNAVKEIGSFTITEFGWSVSTSLPLLGPYSVSVSFGYANGTTAVSSTFSYTSVVPDPYYPTTYSGLQSWWAADGSDYVSSYMSQAPTAFSAITNVTITSGINDPVGGTSAYRITDNSTNAFHDILNGSSYWQGEPVISGDIEVRAIVSRGATGTLNVLVGSAESFGIITDLADRSQYSSSISMIFKSATSYLDVWTDIRVVSAAAASCCIELVPAHAAQQYVGSGNSINIYTPDYWAKQRQITRVYDIGGNSRHLEPTASTVRPILVNDETNGGKLFGCLVAASPKNAPLDSANLAVASGSFTLVGRFYFNSTAASIGLIFYCSGTGSRAMQVRRDGTNIELFRYNDAGSSGTAVIATGLTTGWHTLAVTFDSSTGTAIGYLDKGAGTSATAISGALTATSGKVEFNGCSASEIALYNSVKSKSDCDYIADGFASRKGVVL